MQTIYRIFRLLFVPICERGNHSSFCQCQKCGSSFPVTIAERILKQINIDPSVDPLLSNITRVKTSVIPESVHNEHVLERKRSMYIADSFRDDETLDNFFELARVITSDNETMPSEEVDANTLSNIIYNNSEYLQESGGIVGGTTKLKVRQVRAYEKIIQPDSFLKLECFVDGKFESNEYVVSENDC